MYIYYLIDCAKIGLILLNDRVGSLMVVSEFSFDTKTNRSAGIIFVSGSDPKNMHYTDFAVRTVRCASLLPKNAKTFKLFLITRTLQTECPSVPTSEILCTLKPTRYIL